MIGLGNGLAPNRWQAITWNNDGPAHGHEYASAGLNELSLNCQTGNNKVGSAHHVDYMANIWTMSHITPPDLNFVVD